MFVNIDKTVEIITPAHHKNPESNNIVENASPPARNVKKHKHYKHK